jgi:hypothetical protein
VSEVLDARRSGRAKPVYSTAGARDAAERLGLTGVLEERVREAILAGRKHRYLPGFPREEDVAYVLLDDELVGVLRRVPARLDPARSAWLVVAVRRAERPERLRAVEADPPAAAQERTAAPQGRIEHRFGAEAVPGATGADSVGESLRPSEAPPV